MNGERLKWTEWTAGWSRGVTACSSGCTPGRPIGRLRLVRSWSYLPRAEAKERRGDPPPLPIPPAIPSHWSVAFRLRHHHKLRSTAHLEPYLRWAWPRGCRPLQGAASSAARRGASSRPRSPWSARRKRRLAPGVRAASGIPGPGGSPVPRRTTPAPADAAAAAPPSAAASSASSAIDFLTLCHRLKVRQRDVPRDPIASGYVAPKAYACPSLTACVQPGWWYPLNF